MVRARKLTKRYGVRTILDRLDFEVEQGERVALLGSNGAGKTTLFRCLLGLVGFEGQLTVDGLDAGPAGREVRSRVAYVPQVPPVFDLSLTGFVELFAGLRGVPVAAVGERIEELGLSLAETGARPLRALSGGMIQKAYLALALAAGSPILLLDEPTASLDPSSRRDLLRHLTGVGRETTIILASHRLEEIESLADRVLVLASGTIAFDGSLDALLSTAGVETGLRVEATRDDHLDLLLQLRQRTFPERDFRRLPSVLEDLMGSLAGNHRGGPS